ncbi:MAG: helix-turn-helix transcriptional regulator [Opitutaceae bacterium]
MKLFKCHLHATPMRHVWETRTRQGMRLLRDTGLTVSEIASRCGFSTPFHFSRWVRTISGVAPREFRARAWALGDETRAP